MKNRVRQVYRFGLARLRGRQRQCRPGRQLIGIVASALMLTSTPNGLLADASPAEGAASDLAPSVLLSPGEVHQGLQQRLRAMEGRAAAPVDAEEDEVLDDEIPESLGDAESPLPPDAPGGEFDQGAGGQ